MTLVLLVGMLALVGCSNNKSKEDSPAPPPPTLGQLPPVPAPLPMSTGSPGPVPARVPMSTVSPRPVPARVPMSTVSPGPVPARVPKATASPASPTAPAPAAAPMRADVVGGGKVYILERGDTLAKIAREQLGGLSHLRELINANPGIHPDYVYPGQEIYLP